MAPALQQENAPTSSAPAFRIDQQLHQILYKPEPQRSILEVLPEPSVLPEPPYPIHADPQPMTKSEYQKLNAIRTWKTWGAPYFKSRWYRNDLRPIIPYLFTEVKCNLDCHYCWSYNNKVKGMTEDTARRSIDWLHSMGSRVLALMGGEPLLRPKLIHKVVYYSAKKDIFVYLPTNGRLMKPDVIDRLGDAGIATVNLAVDSVKERKELPKALEPIRPYFDYLVKRQHYYGYTVMFNINICRTNIEDVKELMRGAGPASKRRPGQNSLIIRTDGTLAPCFRMYSATHDWGAIENPKFDVQQLDEMKKECSKHCLSTCNYILAYCYDTK